MMMTKSSLLLLATLFVGELSILSHSFSISSKIQHDTNKIVSFRTTKSELRLAKKNHPEFQVLDDEDDDDDGWSWNESGLPTSGDYIAIDNRKEHQTETEAEAATTTTNFETAPVWSANREKPEYGALSPGTVVQIQVGDVSLARKAWKKRRRSGSPLLIPCSVLNVDRQSMVRWNLIHLLEKFGLSQKDGIEISTPQLADRYKKYLRSSLQIQADALGFETVRDMIVSLFNKKAQESYGVRLVENEEEGVLCLKAPISRFTAQKRAASVPMLQFREHKEGEYGNAETMTHTGYIRAKTTNPGADRPTFNFIPLSAALRVSQKDDLDSGRVEEDSIHPAVVYDFDAIGDSGSPLLTLSLNPRGVREGMKIKPDKRYMPIENPAHLFNELTVGDGPYRARVVQLIPGKALVDLEVGRKVGSQGMVKVLGGLRFQDSVEVVKDSASPYGNFVDDDIDDVIDDVLDEFEEDEEDDDDGGDGLVEDLLSLRAEDSFEEGTFEDGEEEEDISDLFTMNDDGSLTYTDPESGESQVIDENDEDYAEMMNVQKLISEHAAAPNPKAKQPPKMDKPKAKKKSSSSPVKKTRPSNLKFKSKRLRVGDHVDVYIRSVSKQSSQFTVTTNPYVQGLSAKEIKKDSDAQKKLKRLKKSLGGSLKKIWEVEGQECTGIVKATSNNGNWVYVKPELNDLPVGIAALDEGMDALAVGDNVQVQIAGVDEQRGQLSMKYIGKLSP